MKTDRKPKAEKSPPKGKAVKEAKRAVPKTNGKHTLAAYEHIPVGIVESSLDGRYMDVNEEFCRILGYSRRELLRRGIKDCMHEDDHAIDSRLYEQLVAGKIPFYRIEKRFLRKDGEIIWVELTRALVCDEKGNPLYTVGVVLDISDRKDVEKVLRESVERLRLATGAARMFMWEWDFQSQSYTIADNFEQVLGFSGGLLPKNKFETLWALSPKEDVDRISQEFEGAVQDQRDLHAVPYRVINPENGQVVWLEISAKIVYDHDGNPERMFGVAQNITESRNIQNEIALISRVPEENPNPVMRITRDGRISYANPASANLLEDWMQGLQPAIPVELQKTVTQTLTSGMKIESEFGHLGRHFSFTVVPQIESGYVNLYGQDITERKQAEQALRSSEERMRLAMEASRMVAWEWDPNTDRVTTSENMAEVYGLSAVDGADAAFSLIWPEDLAVHREKVERVTRDGGDYHSEFRVTRPLDGRVIWMEERATALTNAAGQVTRLVGVVTDITERKQMETALRESAERFRAMVSQTTAGIAESDLDSRLVFVNPGLSQMLGYPEEELLGKTIWELTYTEDLEENKRLFKRMLEQGESYQFEKRFLRKDGSSLWTSVSVTTINDLAGKPKGGVGVVLDIDKRKQVEADLAEYAHQQEALYDLSDKLHRTTSLEEVYNAALDAIFTALHCSRASILLFDESDVMRFVAWRGLSDPYRQAAEGHSPWKPDAKDPKPVRMDDIRTADLEESLRFVIQGEGIGSLAFIPLVSNGKLIGKFMVYFDIPHAFDGEQLDLSLTIARQLATGIDRQRAEEGLRQSEERFRQAANASGALVYEVDLVSGLSAIVHGLESLTGYDPQEVGASSNWWHSLIHPDDLPAHLAQLDKLLESGGTDVCEYCVRHRNGEWVFVQDNRLVIKNEAGQPVRLVGAVIDITERKRSEEALARERELLTRLFETMPVIVSIYDPETNSLRLNAEFERLLGWKSEDVTVASLLESLYPDAEYRNDVLQRMAAAGRNDWVEVRVQTRAGRSLDSLWSNISILDGEKLVTGLALGIDITERKQTEKRLALLSEISDMLRNFDDPYELMYAISKAVGEHLHVKRVLFNEIDLEHDREIVHRDYHNGLDSVAGVHRISDYSSVTSAEVSAGRTVVNHDSKSDPRTALDYEKTYAPSGERAYVAVPLMRDNHWVASLWVSDDTPRQWSREDISLLETVAERTWAIIEKLRINTALRESEQRFREIFETAGVSVWVEDFSEVKRAIEGLRAQGVHDLHAYFREHPDFVQNAIALVRVLDVNPETLELFRASSKEDLLGSLSKVFSPETEQIFVEELVALAEGREMLRAETQIQTLDGEPVSVLFTVHFAPSAGDQSRVVVTLTDITERKRAENALRIRARQQHAVARLGELALRERDLQKVFDQATATIAETLEIEYCKVLELLEGGGSLLLRAGVGWQEGLVGSATVDTGLDSQAGFTLQSPAPVVADDLRQEPRFNGPPLLVNHGVVSGMSCIIRASGGLPWGVLGTHSTRHVSFTQDDVNFLVSMANILGDAIQREDAEDALRASEERYRFIVENTSDGIWWVELNEPMPVSLTEEEQLDWYYRHAVMHQCNLGLARMYGYDSIEDVVGLPMRILMPREIPENLELSRQFIRSGYRLVDAESREVSADGRELVFLNNMVGIVEGGKLTGEWGTNRDITERKRAEEALRRNEQMFSTLVDAAPFGVYFIDSEFRLRTINKGSEAVFSGIDPLIGRDFAEILRIIWQEPFATEAIERFRHTLRTGESFISPPVVEERANIDEIEAYDWQIHRITLSDGSYGVVCYFYDLSEQKRMEDTVRASESLYRAIARNIPGGGVYVVDKDFRYLVAEGPVTEAFGLTRERLEGHTVSEVFPDERGERMVERLKRNFAGESVDFETHFNGRVFWTQQAPLHESLGQAIILTLDITERKQAEEALRQSEERFARFMQHLPGLAWIKDMEGRYVYVNAAAEKAFRTTRENLYGRMDEAIFTPDIAAQFRRNDARALADEKGMQAIETLEQEDGILHYSLVSKFPIPGPDGKPALIGGTAVDITERLQAEEALRESEERFRAILRQATAGIVRKDAEGRLVYVNEAFCNMLGRTEAELLGKTVWEFMHPDDVAENQRSYDRVMVEGISFKLERRFLREDGSVIWVDASVSPIIDSTGKPQSAVAVEVDITARKQAEEALQQLNLQLEERVLSRTERLRSVNRTLREEVEERQKAEQALRKSEADARANEEKLSTLFELLPVGISFLDPQGQIIQINPALTNILKLSKQQLSNEVVNRSRKYVRPNGTPLAPTDFASWRALQEGKTVYNVETGVIAEDGEVIWTSVSAAPVNVANVGAVVVTVDITESKHAERALQDSRERLQILSQRLVEVQEEERRAIARELHDRVGQTLAALNINLIIISGQLDGKVDEQTSTRLSDSMKLVAETIALVRDVMSNLRPSVLDDYGLEAAIDSHVSQYASRYEIGVKFEKPAQPLPRLGPSIEMTFLRIAQEALMNSARHAQATQVHVRLWQEHGTVCLAVQDNGTGISSWQSANRPGSHGLTIMRERAEAFGGNLKVSSVPGKGTKVEVKIPVETSDPSQTPKKVSP